MPWPISVGLIQPAASHSPSVDHGSVGSADTGTAILPEAIRSPSSSLCCGTTLPLTRRGSSS